MLALLIIIALVVVIIVQTWRVRVFRKRALALEEQIATSKDPLLILPLPERQAYVRELVERDQENHNLKLQEGHNQLLKSFTAPQLNI